MVQVTHQKYNFDAFTAGKIGLDCKHFIIFVRNNLTYLKNFFTDNVNSILGAVSIHLMVVIAFLWFKLGEVDEMKKEQVLIEFNEEIKPLEEEKTEKRFEMEGPGEGIPALDQKTLHSIASNVASKLDPEINTDNYEKQVMQELGISTLKAPGGQMEQEAQENPDENAISQNENKDTEEKDYSVPNIIRKDNTTVSYFLEGRWHTYLYIPTYKCQGGGTVILDIVISQAGKVVSAIIAENKSTTDPCLREEAYKSALSASFNSDNRAPVKQLGTISYIFLPQ